jgi:hypothetical protein
MTQHQIRKPFRVTTKQSHLDKERSLLVAHARLHHAPQKPKARRKRKGFIRLRHERPKQRVHETRIALSSHQQTFRKRAAVKHFKSQRAHKQRKHREKNAVSEAKERTSCQSAHVTAAKLCRK